jgi:ABC-type nickel/cobalt efflux system permease component RcnA
MACIQIVVQFLFSVVSPEENPFFSILFLQTIAFVLVGVTFYWLVFRYVVRVHTDASATPDVAYSPATYTPTKATNETYENELPNNTINTNTTADDTLHTHITEHADHATEDIHTDTTSSSSTH